MLRRILVIVVLLAVGGGALWMWQQRERGDGLLTLYGNVDVRQVELAFRVDGRIDEVMLEEGDRVETGAVVARLDASPYADELALREAQVAEQEARVAELRAGPRPEEIDEAAATVAQRKAGLEVATLAYERSQQLLNRRAGSEAERDERLARMRESRAQLAAAEEKLKLLRAGSRAEDIAAGEAALAAARAQRDIARRRFADTDLRAPNAGIVLTRVREPGAIVATGQPVLSVTLASPVWVRAYVGEPDLGRIEPGMQARIHTDSRPGTPYTGQIGFISPRAEFTPKSVETPELRTALVYRLRVIVDDPDGGLRQGMPVTVTLPDARPAPGADRNNGG